MSISLSLDFPHMLFLLSIPTNPQISVFPFSLHLSSHEHTHTHTHTQYAHRHVHTHTHTRTRTHAHVHTLMEVMKWRHDQPCPFVCPLVPIAIGDKRLPVPSATIGRESVC